jgi:hypothetical protein
VLSKGIKFGVMRVLGVGCYARIRCGFPVNKGFSVGIVISPWRAGCGEFRVWCLVWCGCGAGLSYNQVLD